MLLLDQIISSLNTIADRLLALHGLRTFRVRTRAFGPCFGEIIGVIQSCYDRNGEPMCYITQENFQCPRSTPMVMVTMQKFHEFPKNLLENQY